MFLAVLSVTHKLPSILVFHAVACVIICLLFKDDHVRLISCPSRVACHRSLQFGIVGFFGTYRIQILDQPEDSARIAPLNTEHCTLNPAIHISATFGALHLMPILAAYALFPSMTDI